MKKFAILLLVFTLCIGMLAGCGGNQSPDAPVAENDAPVSTPEEPTPSEEPAPAPSEEPAPAPSEEPAPAPSEEPAPAPSEEPAPAPSEEPAPAPSEEPAPAPSEEPAPAPSEEPAPAPSEEPAPAPSEEPAEEPAPTPSEEPAEEPAPAPSEEPSVDDSLYGSLTIYDVHNETTFTFDKAYLEDDWYLHVKAGSNYTAKKDSGDPAWIYAEYASYLDFAGCWMVGIDSSMGPQCWTDAPGGCVDNIFQQLTADFGENCQEGQRVLPLIQYEYEGCYILFLDN